MVSPLDIGLVQVFQIIFPFLFVLTVMYAFLMRIAPFKENAVYAAIMATSLAVLTMFFPIVIKIINVMAPWFVLMFVIMVLALLAYYIIGYDEDSLTKAIREGEYSSAMGWWIFAMVLLIAIGSTAAVISEERGFTGLTADNTTAALTSGGDEASSFFKTILHPKVLGMGVILLIAFFAISALSKASEK